MINISSLAWWVLPDTSITTWKSVFSKEYFSTKIISRNSLKIPLTFLDRCHTNSSSRYPSRHLIFFRENLPNEHQLNVEKEFLNKIWYDNKVLNKIKEKHILQSAFCYLFKGTILTGTGNSFSMRFVSQKIWNTEILTLKYNIFLALSTIKNKASNK